MLKTEVVQARIDVKTKTQVQRVLSSLGLSMSDAITIYFRQIILKRGIPFEVKIPNSLTMKTIEKAERGEEVSSFSSEEELFKDLGI